MVRSIAHLKSSLSYFELTGTLAFCLPPNKDSVTSESAADFVQTLPREQIVWSRRNARANQENREARASAFCDCDVKLMLFAPWQGGKKLHKIVICIFWLPLLRSVSWASSVTEQGVLVLNSFGFCHRNGFFPLFSCCT